MKPSVNNYKSVITSVLAMASAIFSFAALPQTASAQSPCLVYNSRSTSSSTGYASYSSPSIGLMVLGPQFSEETEVFSNNGMVNAQVTKRDAQVYSLSTSGGRKTYFKQVTSEVDGAADTKRVVGFFNMAPRNSAKPALFFAMMPFDYTSTSLSEADGSIIGKAVQMAPYAGGPKILMAPSMQSSYRFYDLNANLSFGNPGNMPQLKNLGQDGETRLALLSTGRTTYSHSASLNELVKNKDFAAACAAIEQWLQSKGYEDESMP